MTPVSAKALRRQRARDIEEGLRFAGLLLSSSSLMVILKVGVGILSGSHALMASALYSVNDVLSSIAVAVSLRVARRGPTAVYPYGYGKVEFIAVGLVSLSIALGVFFMFFFSLLDVMGGVTGPPHMAAISLAALSAVVSWLLARKGHRLALRLESPALKTSADHHHADAVGSLAAIFGVGGALLGFHAFDRIVAIFETLHIVVLSGTLLAKAVQGLMDTALPEEDVELVRRACLRVGAVERLAHVRSRRAGSEVWLDLAVAVPAHLSVGAAHRVRRQLKSAVVGVLGPAVVLQVRLQGPDFVEHLPGPGGSPHG